MESSDIEARSILASDAYSAAHAPTAHQLMACVSEALYGEACVAMDSPLLREQLELMLTTVGTWPRQELGAPNEAFLLELLWLACLEFERATVPRVPDADRDYWPEPSDSPWGEH